MFDHLFEVDIPTEVFFNPHKHHLPDLRRYLDTLIASDAKDSDIFEHLINSLDLRNCRGATDYYEGALTSEELCTEVLAQLEAAGVNDKKSYGEWLSRYGQIQRFGLYVFMTLSDGTQWTLRETLDEVNPYVHLHPCRDTPMIFRVKANTFKSITLAWAIANRAGEHEITLEHLNAGRALVDMSPLTDWSQALTRFSHQLTSRT